MKQIISLDDWSQLTPAGQRFIENWKRIKGYPNESPLLTLGQCIELLLAISHKYYKDDFLHGTRNNCLMLDESEIAWDGEELIDTLWYEIVQNVKKRTAKTFTEPVEA